MAAAQLEVPHYPCYVFLFFVPKSEMESSAPFRWDNIGLEPQVIQADR